MALRFGALEDALLNAGASPEKAARAAGEVAAIHSISRIQVSTRVLVWIMGATLVASLLTLLKLLIASASLP